MLTPAKSMIVSTANTKVSPREAPHRVFLGERLEIVKRAVCEGHGDLVDVKDATRLAHTRQTVAMGFTVVSGEARRTSCGRPGEFWPIPVRHMNANGVVDLVVVVPERASDNEVAE